MSTSEWGSGIITQLADDDLKAIYASLRTVAPVRNPVRKTGTA